jgi:CheY-like chemotaxis protein
MTTPARKPSGGEEPPGSAAASAAALRLVLIEDDPDYAFLVQEMLRDAFPGRGVEISAFESLAAIEADPEHSDCVLVDLSLPDGRGLEVLDAVQRDYAGVPVVVLTGAEDEELALQAVERGAQDYLVKRGAEPDSLARSIR